MFLPILMAHQIFDAQLVWHALLAFVSFGLIASATFLINDLVDIEADRKHPTKRYRPLAAGPLKLAHAKVAIPFLLAGSMALAFAMPRPVWFLTALATCLALGQMHVFYLKRKPLVYVLALAALHVLRILGGKAATGIPLSSWLLTFAVFLFFSFALPKRYAELREAGDAAGLRCMGRGYQAGDLETLSQMGMSSALASALIVAL